MNEPPETPRRSPARRQSTTPDPLPRSRTPVPVADATGDGTPPPASTPWWRRWARSPHGALGVAVLAAALLLWPFAGWSVVPWLIGIALLVVLRLLRLDGLLRGWALHLGGLAVVAGLLIETGPWVWALAAGIGVLLAGLVRLPRWKVAAVGAVLCLVSGVGYGLTQFRATQQDAQVQEQQQAEAQGQEGADRPQGVLPVLLNRIAQDVPGPVCENLLAPSAVSAFVAASGRADCASAVAALAARVVDRDGYSRAAAPSTPLAEGSDVDACRLTWADGVTAGPPLGHLTIGRKVDGPTYVVTGFTACS